MIFTSRWCQWSIIIVIVARASRTDRTLVVTGRWIEKSRWWGDRRSLRACPTRDETTKDITVRFRHRTRPVGRWKKCARRLRRRRLLWRRVEIDDSRLFRRFTVRSTMMWTRLRFRWTTWIKACIGNRLKRGIQRVFRTDWWRGCRCRCNSVRDGTTRCRAQA